MVLESHRLARSLLGVLWLCCVFPLKLQMGFVVIRVLSSGGVGSVTAAMRAGGTHGKPACPLAEIVMLSPI
eukprot:2860131-Amphidinium_carterae.1